MAITTTRRPPVQQSFCLRYRAYEQAHRAYNDVAHDFPAEVHERLENVLNRAYNSLTRASIRSHEDAVAALRFCRANDGDKCIPKVIGRIERWMSIEAA